MGAGGGTGVSASRKGGAQGRSILRAASMRVTGFSGRLLGGVETMIEVRRLAPDNDLLAAAWMYVESWRTAHLRIVPQAYLDALAPDDWAGSLTARADRTWVACVDG